jgi:predicted ATPase/class 3 adenylate cyclase
MISFGPFRLDRRTRRLRYRGAERPLRAKSSAVLLYLAENPNRLVTHEELLRAAWSGTAVSQTVLRVCISEIRAVLGDDADRFLTTVPRRGYRFTVEAGDGGPARSLFVGRDVETAALHEALAGVHRGRRQVVLVSGETGAGKTALLDQFLEELRADGGVRCARGQSLEHHGSVEGCAAILDLLSRLCDEAAGEEVVEALTRWAPGWLVQLPGRVDDVTADGLRGRAADPSWDGRLRELSEAVETLAAEKPLVLVLEDLQWSDASTIDALAHLTRRTVAARLLVVASYRSDSLPDHHPFVSARQHLHADRLCSEIELGPLPADQAEAYVTRRLAPQPLASGVARAIHDASSGHALRLVATVDRLLEARRLVLRDGAWRLDGGLAATILEPFAQRAVAQPAVEVVDEPSVAAERRQLTVMSCDLVGASDLAQVLDPEDLRSVVRAFQETASAVIQGHGGQVAQYSIDGLLVYFCYPQAHEDDAARAVRAGLEILAALAVLNDSLEPEYRVRLAARIGIHTGPVVIGEMGGGVKHGMIALGDVPHTAVRVQRVAEADSVVITGATQRLVVGMFVIEDRGTRELEGMPQALSLHRVVRPGVARGRIATAAGRLTPFVGRQAELTTLDDCWDATRRGAGRSVTVLGEAGVGKSRLAYQLHQRLAADAPHTWLESSATPYTAGTPFQPVIALVAQGLGLAAEDSTADRLAKIERGLGVLATAETVALIADLLGLPPPVRLQLSPELHRRRTIELLAQWTLSLSAARPTVLLVEDLHWCDPSSLELLGHLVAQSHTAPLLVLLTARPEFRPTWASGAHVATLELARLGERDTRDMVRTLVTETLPSGTVDALVARSDGVPLYVEELVKSVVEPGGTRGVEAIPVTLADSLMGRLDRLTAAKEVAQRAAVLGREFTYPLLAAVSELDETVLRHELARLVEAEILFVRGAPPDVTYVFKHALIQETAVQSLLKRTRQQFHARVGQVLEERFPDSVAAEPEVVARHYEQAGLTDQAIAHYQRAGERAAERSANEEAIGHLRRALALVATLPESRQRLQRELALQMAIGGPLSAARGWTNPEYEGVFVRARELVSEIGESPELPRVLEGMAAAYLMKGDLATSAEVARQTLAAAERTGETFDRLLGEVALGTALLYQGSLAQAEEHLAQAIQLYDPGEHAAFAYTLGFDRGGATHAHAANCQLYLGHLDRALAMSEQAIALARRVDHPPTLALALFQAGVVCYERRELDRLATRIDELVPLAERVGLPFWLGGGQFFRGVLRAEAGQGDAGLAEMQQALIELAGLGYGLGAPAVLLVFAKSLWKLGRHDEALGAVDLGLAQAQQLGQNYADAELHRVRAEILLDRDGATANEAAALLRQSLEIARRQQAKLFELRAAATLARVWQDQGKQKQASALLAPVYGWFSEGLDTQDLKDAKAQLEQLASPSSRASTR